MNPARQLAYFLRCVGTVAGSALFFAVLPMHAMDSIHRLLGMGPLPVGPIVEYLARSTSFAYALLGALLWTLSFDIERYRALIHGIGYAFLALSLFLLGTDIHAPLPRFWQITEGPITAALGLTLIMLTRRVR